MANYTAADIKALREKTAAGMMDVKRALDEADGDMTAAEIEDIRRQAAAWRGAEVERGFSMALGRFGDPADAGCVAV